MSPIFRFRSDVLGYGAPAKGLLRYKGGAVTETSSAEPEPPPVPGEYLQVKYVATTGSAANDGSLASPWSITAGLANATAGTLLYIRGGTYSGTNSGGGYAPTFMPSRSGTGESKGARIHIKNYPGETVALSSSQGPVFGTNGNNYIWWDGMTVNGADGKGAIIQLGHHNRVRNCNISNITKSIVDNCDGIRVDSASYNIIEYNTIHDCWNVDHSLNSAGFKSYASQNCIFRYNMIYNCASPAFIKSDHDPRHADHAIYRNYLSGSLYSVRIAGDCLRTSIYENLILGGSNGVLLSWGGTTGTDPLQTVYVYRNTIIAPSTVCRIGEQVAYDQNDIHFWNNIVCRNTGYEIITMNYPIPSDMFSYWNYNRYYRVTGTWTAELGRYDSTTVYDTFSAWRGRGYDANSTQGDPLFEDYAGGDYRLQATSPCKDAGRYEDDLGCYSVAYWLPNVGAGHAPDE
jgi:hypothetical protein